MTADGGAESWLEFDTPSDALRSICHAADFTRASQRDPFLVKWAVIALHNGLQGLMVCHLSGGADLGAAGEKERKAFAEWDEAVRAGRPASAPRVGKIVDARELFRRLTGRAPMMERAGDVITVSADETRAFGRLHTLRNDFSHFSPKLWLLETSGLPATFAHVATLIERIMDAGHAVRHAEPELIARARAALLQLRPLP